MLERVLHKLPGLLTTQESQDRKRQELENAVENLRFFEDRVLSDQQVKDTLATCTSGIVVLSPGDPPLVIASRDRKYGGVILSPERRSDQPGKLGLFVDLSKRFATFFEIDELFLRIMENDPNSSDFCLPTNIITRIANLPKERIFGEVRRQTGVSLGELLKI